MPEPTRVVHTQGRWLSGPDIQTETTPMPGGGGTRSLRMTVRMPVGTLSALVSLSGVSPHDALSSLRSAHASFPATDSPAMQHPAVPPRAPAVPPRETQSLDDVAAQSLGHHTHVCRYSSVHAVVCVFMRNRLRMSSKGLRQRRSL
jgi:hypothetical protein